MKACFMGLGYIGLPTAIIAAKHGVTVTGVDINQEVVDKTIALYKEAYTMLTGKEI